MNTRLLIESRRLMQLFGTVTHLEVKSIRGMQPGLQVGACNKSAVMVMIL